MPATLLTNTFPLVTISFFQTYPLPPNTSDSDDSDDDSSDSDNPGGSSGSGSTNNDTPNPGADNSGGSHPANSTNTADVTNTAGSTNTTSGTNTAGSTNTTNGTNTAGGTPVRPSAGGGTNGTGNPSADTQNSSHVSIDMQKTSILYEETISSIRGQDIDVMLQMGDGISWTINGRDILADEANGIDMGVKTGTGNIPEAILEQAVRLSETGTAIGLSLAHDGPFDFQPVLTFQTEAAFAGCMATLFYYNAEADKLEYISETAVTESGEIIFPFSHASDYVIIISSAGLSAITAITADGAEGTEDNNGDGTQQSGQPDDAVAVSAVPAQDEASRESGGFNPAVLLVVALIVLVLIIIACTAFLMLHSKDGNEEEPEQSDDMEEEDYAETEGEEAIEIEYLDKEPSDEEPFDEYSEEDDYFEPETKSANPPEPPTYEYDDGFDGFE